jgi:uncharacterized iron-regulated membrane protein
MVLTCPGADGRIDRSQAMLRGSPFDSPYHYLIWTKGRQPLTGRLFSPVPVDARTGELARAVTMPWYLRALEVSRPLHFGDDGGLPLKILWALFDLVTIIVLVSGVYLWLSKATADLQAKVESGALSMR